MSKYFNKALFFAERRIMLGSMAAYSLIYLSCLLQTFIDMRLPAKVLNEILPEPPYRAVNVLYLWFVAIAIISVLISYFEKDKKYYFMLTQPFSRDSIIVTKTAGFLISFLVPTILYGITSYIVLIANQNYFGSYYGVFSQHLLLTLLGLTAVITFITMFDQLMQMLFGKAIAGVIFPIVLYFMLFFSLNIGGSFISKRLGFLKNVVGYVNSLLFNHGTSFVNSGEFQSASIYALKYIENPKIYISLALIALAAAIFYLSLQLNRRINAENTSSLFLFAFSETIFKVIFSLAITIVGSLIISGAIYYLYSSIKGINFSTYLIKTYGLSGKETIEQNLYLVLNILWIPLYAIIYKVFSRLMKLRRAV